MMTLYIAVVLRRGKGQYAKPGSESNCFFEQVVNNEGCGG